MGMIRLIAAGLAAAAIASCAQEPQQAEALGSRYRLKADIASPGGGKAICYARPNGKCDIRVPATVRRIGANDDFISAEVERIGLPGAMHYYFVVRDFDNPRADGARCLDIVGKGLAAEIEKNAKLKCAKLKTLLAVDETPSDCAVRGPFSEKTFEKLRNCLCAPAEFGSDDVNCIPNAMTAVLN